MNKEQAEQLESLVDSCGLTGVILSLSIICEGKAEHIRTNWQDASLADLWDTVADNLSDYGRDKVLNYISPAIRSN